jgi:hypothetical protein
MRARLLIARLGRGVAHGAEREPREGAIEPFGARDAEVGDLEDLRLTEAAAEHVPRRQIAVDHVYGVDRREARGQAAQRVRRAHRVESEARLVDRIGDAIFERRAFDASVDVFDRDPRRGLRPEDVRAARVDETHDERRGRHALVQASERHGLFLRDQLGLHVRVGERRQHHLHDHRRRTLRALPPSEVRHAHTALAHVPLQEVANVRLDFRADDGPSNRRRRKRWLLDHPSSQHRRAPDAALPSSAAIGMFSSSLHPLPRRRSPFSAGERVIRL